MLQDSLRYLHHHVCGLNAVYAVLIFALSLPLRCTGVHADGVFAWGIPYYVQVQQAKLEVTKTQAQEARIKRELAWMVERRQIETEEALAHERAAVEDVRSRLTAAISSRDDDISKLIDECKKLQVSVDTVILVLLALPEGPQRRGLCRAN